MTEKHQLASELLVERLIDRGVDTVFGLPGDGPATLRPRCGRPSPMRVRRSWTYA